MRTLRNCFFAFFYYFLFISNNENVVHAEQLKNNNNRLEANTKNPNFDLLTGILHHAQYTKKCGGILPTLSIDFNDFWTQKFDPYINKATRLASALNYLINQYSENDAYLQRIDQSLIYSFNYFLFSNMDVERIVESKKSYNSSFLSNSHSFDEKIRSSKNTDNFVLSYGVIFDDDKVSDSDTSESSQYKNCIFVNNDYKNIGRLYTSNECTKFDESTNNEEKSKKLNNEKNIIDDITDIKLTNCNSWYFNLKNNYKKIISKLTDSTIYSQILNTKGIDYESILKHLVKSKEFSRSQWCGFYECHMQSTKDNPSRLMNDDVNSSENNKSNWILLYSAPLFSTDYKFKGALMLKLNLSNLDINQCNDKDDLFSNTHKCKKNTKCMFKKFHGFRLGGYNCQCSDAKETPSFFNTYNGTDIEKEYWLLKNMKKNVYNTSFNCFDCKEDCCETFSNESLALNQMFNRCKSLQNKKMRRILLFIQCLLIFISIFAFITTYVLRKSKVIKYSTLILLEIILIGSIMLYSSVLVQTFDSSEINCILSVWLREMGFTIVYGAFNLRIYKILTEFQSRKACGVQLQDKDILKILSFLIICTTGYLISWTLIDVDYYNQGYSVLIKDAQIEGQIFSICKIKWWNYFISAAELMFLLIGMYLLYCTRYAPTEFYERKQIAIVIYTECVTSISTSLIKYFFLYKFHPDIILIIEFVRCHATVTLLIILIFFTKFFLILKFNYQDVCSHNSDGLTMYLEASKDLLNLKSNENEEHEIPIMEIKQEDVRLELKRLYMQLHVQKLLTVKLDNPHVLVKRKANRKNKPISQMKQILKDSESINGKTPEESTSSIQ